MEIKKTYIGQCEHIDNCCITDSKCLKRFFHVTNPFNGDREIIIFCNDWIKLNAENKSHNNEDKYYWRDGYVDLITREIKKHFNILGSPYASSTHSISEYCISVVICEKPWVYVGIPLLDIIENYKKYKNYITRELFVNSMKRFFADIQYKKYKTRYKELIADVNRIGKNYHTQLDLEIAIDELITKTFEYLTKNK